MSNVAPRRAMCVEDQALKRFWALLIMILVSCIMHSSAHAQDGDAMGIDEEVTLTIARFGVGGAARLGDWVGIQVNLMDNGSSPRDIILRFAIMDADGDETQYDRVITASPGQQLSYWLYGWLPFRDTGDGYEVRAYEGIETSDSSNIIGYRAGKMLGRTIVRSRPMFPGVALMGVIGPRQAGLDQYSVMVKQRQWMPMGHELTLTATGLTIQSLPDRWQGLVAFDTLVWTEPNLASSDPNRLTIEQARAIRNWVAHGGHLVVVLPTSGDPWFGSAHPLRTLMPDIKRPDRREGVNLEAYRSLLTESRDIPLPKNAAVHVFEPVDDAQRGDAIPILNGADGKCVVIRKLSGSGAVTVVGLDLTHGELRRVGLPDVESIWHRVLGMRGRAVRIDQMSETEIGDVSSRPIRLFDSGIAGAIAKTGRAVQGVLFGLLVFVVYWIVAGPGGFFVLRSRKKQHHAWVVFVGCIGVFTALSWMGATALRPKTKDISHLTLLQQVDGQPTMRARSWMSIMLPTYGSSLVSLVDPDAVDSEFLNAVPSGHLLSPWASPTTSGGLTNGYPDNTGYRIEARNPSGFRVPTRATVKDFLADWFGEEQEKWSMIIPVGEVGDLETPTLELNGTVVDGLVAHGFPGAMTDVRVIVVSRQNRILPPGGKLGRNPISRASVFAPVFTGGKWMPGENLDLNIITTTRRTAANKGIVRDSFFSTAVRKGEDYSGVDLSPAAPLVDRLIMGSMISQFDPPRYGVQNDPVGDRVARRRQTHGWDLGRWFTQPCVIVIGAVKVDPRDASVDGMPVPVFVDGKRVKSSGTTIVTWVYPLASNPPSSYLTDNFSSPDSP
ncbi:MAG: hypothetical protein JKY96_04170 [Phycisphaerales bacterium]|nr:hypothetical protein [Phycisphaerales bacterium]